DLTDFGARKNQLTIIGGIAKINSVIGGHFPADIPPVLLVTTVCERIPLSQRFCVTPVFACAGVKRASDDCLLQIDEDMIHATRSGWVMKRQVNTPIIAACVIHEPA